MSFLVLALLVLAGYMIYRSAMRRENYKTSLFTRDNLLGMPQPYTTNQTGPTSTLPYQPPYYAKTQGYGITQNCIYDCEKLLPKEGYAFVEQCKQNCYFAPQCVEQCKGIESGIINMDCMVRCNRRRHS